MIRSDNGPTDTFGAGRVAVIRTADDFTVSINGEIVILSIKSSQSVLPGEELRCGLAPPDAIALGRLLASAGDQVNQKRE